MCRGEGEACERIETLQTKTPATVTLSKVQRQNKTTKQMQPTKQNKHVSSVQATERERTKRQA